MHADYGLPPNYTIFGRLTAGTDVLDAIATAPTGSQDRPKEPVTHHLHHDRRSLNCAGSEPRARAEVVWRACDDTGKALVIGSHVDRAASSSARARPAAAATAEPDSDRRPMRRSPSPPDGGGIDPGLPQPQFVVPKPGQLAIRPVSVTALTPIVDGHHVTIRADWVSGVEPCNVLDQVEVAKDGTTITVALFEGSSDLNVVCIEIAAYKATLIDLGELDPGAYIVQSADGAAPPASFTVERYFGCGRRGGTSRTRDPLRMRRAISATTRRSRRVPSSGPPSSVSMRSNR